MEEIDNTSAYGESWYAATKVDAPARPPLAVDLDVDVCVIGGGLAGLTTAREVARRGWSVVLLEAGRIAAGASGRNSGFVLPGFAAGPDRIIERVGSARAADLWALSQAGVDYVRDAIVAESMPGVDAQRGWLYVSKTDNGDELTHLAGLFGEFGAEIEGWPTERVRATLRTERYFHAIHFPQAIHIHPLNYALGLAVAAERAGVRICEHTPALSIDPAGVRKRIVTPNARLRASHVVLCGNVQIAALMPSIGAALIPATRYIITTGPLGQRLDEAIDYRGAVSDTDLADNHYRIVGGNRLMWAGRSSMWARNPRRYARRLAADIRKTYPQLGDIAIDHAWSGTLSFSVHGMPQLGELGSSVWLASGFGDHGLNTTAMAGTLIARAIVDGDQTWRQFTPFEVVWAGGMFGRAVMQTYYWTRRLRAALAERRARAAERIHRAQADEPAIAAPELPQSAPESQFPPELPQSPPELPQSAPELPQSAPEQHAGVTDEPAPVIPQAVDPHGTIEQDVPQPAVQQDPVEAGAPSPAGGKRRNRRKRRESAKV